MSVYKIFAGKKIGKGSRDAHGFSSNGEFFSYVASNKQDAIKQFKKEHSNYYIYDVLHKRQ